MSELTNDGVLGYIQRHVNQHEYKPSGWDMADFDEWCKIEFSSLQEPKGKPMIMISLPELQILDDESFRRFMENDRFVALVGAPCLLYIYDRCDKLNIKIEKDEEVLKYNVISGNAAINRCNPS